MTIPVVPSTERPPRMPSRPFSVRSASFSPPGIAISTTISLGQSGTSASAARIIARGTGLIAGSPGASARPGRVTVPTPSPAAKRRPVPGGPRRTLATTSAPCVTSGSSPASLTMPALAAPSERLVVASVKPARPPRGSGISTGSGKPWPTSAEQAAFAAAAAQLPVVQPRLSGPAGTPSSVVSSAAC